MTRAFTTSTRKSDGKPRKLRKATHPQAVWRQARMIMDHQGRKRAGKIVSHKNQNKLSNSPGSIEVISRSHHELEHHGHKQPGKKPTEPYLKRKKKGANT